ncbi:methyltransferase domain-containing protein [Hoeflea sp.]|uniref:methyltransferase domain-containing protein n=1 Tax=Hoeflea sp. TaxID=1940281 RepID=UPI003B02B012
MDNGQLHSASPDALARLTGNAKLNHAKLDQIFSNYDFYSNLFHNSIFTNSEQKNNHIENASYHENRYKKLVQTIEAHSPKRILDVGNDKPFLTWLMKLALPNADFTTLTFPIPDNPFDTYAVDVETENWNIHSNEFDFCIFAEVIEHLWRDPARPIYEISGLLASEGILYLTTPNACELHALTNVLWQANPNQRGKIFPHLESGHVHLYTVGALKELVRENGFQLISSKTFSPYGYTNFENDVADFARHVSPHFDLMGETIEIISMKDRRPDSPVRSKSVYETDCAVLPEGAILSMLAKIR